jgi:hypothetical protein
MDWDAVRSSTTTSYVRPVVFSPNWSFAILQMCPGLVVQRAIAAATGLAQSDVSDILRGRHRVYSYPVRSGA